MVEPIGLSKALTTLLNPLHPQYGRGGLAEAGPSSGGQQRRNLYRFPSILRAPFTGSFQNNAPTGSTVSTSAGDLPRPAEFSGILGGPPQHSPQSGGRSSTPAQHLPRSPPNTPPIPSRPQNGHSDPISAGPSNGDRRQRNHSQDKLLTELGEGVNRMNSNLEVLNSNLGALNNLVKGPYVSRSKKKSRNMEGQPSESDETGTDADDEGPTHEYKPPKRKSRRQNLLHVCSFLIQSALVMLSVLQKLVRAHTCALLKKVQDSPHCDVTQEEADGFDNSAGYPCTKEAFRLYLAGTPAHKWNQAAAVVFTDNFLEGRDDFEHDRVKKCFLTHLRTLISKFKKGQQVKGLAPREQENAKNAAATQTRRSTRKHNVSQIAPVLHSPPLRTLKALPPPRRGRQNYEGLEAVRAIDRRARARGYVFRRDGYGGRHPQDHQDLSHPETVLEGTGSRRFLAHNRRRLHPHKGQIYWTGRTEAKKGAS